MAAIHTNAMIPTYSTEFAPLKLVPKACALKLNVFLTADMNAPLSTPPIEESMLSVIPLKRMFLISEVMWVAGNRLQKPCTPSENWDKGIYAPITKPAAADKMPKNAVLVDDVLKNSMTSINKAVEETDPRNIMP